MSRPRTSGLIMAMLAVLAQVAVGCGGAAVQDRSGTGATEIRIASYTSYQIDPEIQTAVEKRLNVQIEVVAVGDSAEALASVALTAGNPDADLFFGVDNTLLATALASKAFTAVPVPNRVAIPVEFQLDSTIPLVPIDTSSVCVDADSSWFAEHGLPIPTRLEDLLEPRYRGLLVIPDPVKSSPGLVFLAGIHQRLGSQAGEFITGLRANQVSVAGSWDEAYYSSYSVNGGDFPLVVSYSTSPPAEVYFSEGALSSSTTTVLAGTCTNQVEYAGVLAGGRNTTKAAEVLNAMLDADWQSSLPLSNFVLPVRNDVVLPTQYGLFVRPSEAVSLDSSLVSTEQKSWIAAWRETFE